MQYPFSCMPAVLEKIEKTLSSERLSRFQPAASNDKNFALRVCVWNARLCEEFYIPIQFCEIALRNAIHGRLTTVFGEKWYANQTFIKAIPNRHKEELAKTVFDEQRKRDAAFTVNHVVAGMSYGFWLNLMSQSLSNVLWWDGVQSAFPHKPHTLGREEVYDRLERLRKFRNAVMHHYAIFDKGPTAEWQNICTLLGWLCPQTIWLVRELSNPAAVLQRRPRI